jgi:hypothetical protein
VDQSVQAWKGLVDRASGSVAIVCTVSGSISPSLKGTGRQSQWKRDHCLYRLYLDSEPVLAK